MNLYISDIHFGHKNILKLENRPFLDLEEMEMKIIKSWNESVKKDDEVWLLGDFCLGNKKPPEYYLEKLKGRKHLIIGNHDRSILRSRSAIKHLESIDTIKTIEDNNKKIILCHYPLLEWEERREGTWHIYGHIHEMKDEIYYVMKKRKRALNAGCMINNYKPSKLEELIINNK